MLHLRQICVGRTVQKEMQDGLYAVESLFLRMLIDDECQSVFLYAALIAMSHIITTDTYVSDAKPDKGVRYEISGRDHHGYALHIRKGAQEIAYLLNVCLRVISGIVTFPYCPGRVDYRIVFTKGLRADKGVIRHEGTCTFWKEDGHFPVGRREGFGHPAAY